MVPSFQVMVTDRSSVHALPRAGDVDSGSRVDVVGVAAEVREGAAETLFRASQVLEAKPPNDQRPTMRILGICRWGWGTGSVGSEPPERCL